MLCRGIEIDVDKNVDEVLCPVPKCQITQITLFVPQGLAGRIIVSVNGINTIINTYIYNDKRGFYSNLTFKLNLEITEPSDLVCYFYPHKGNSGKINLTYWAV